MEDIDRLTRRAAPERWAVHPDCSAYEISTWGRIKAAKGARPGRILKPYGHGYVQLHCDGEIIVTNYKIGD